MTHVHGRQADEREGVKLLVEQVLKREHPRLATLLVDQGYAGPDLPTWLLEYSGWNLEVVCKRAGQPGFEVQPKRWLAERKVSWMNHSRRLSKEYEDCPHGVKPCFVLP